MHVFVAGATGAVGGLLVPLLIDSGHQVTGMTRTETGLGRLRAQGATPIQVDAFDADGLRNALASAAPDAVIHQLTALAAGSSADNGQIRREGTRNLVDAAKNAGVKRIIAQSVAWAYEPGAGPADETAQLDHTDPARATLVGGVHALEEAVAELQEHVVLRYGTFYGPRTWYSPDGLVADKLAGRLPAESPAAKLLGGLRADDAVTSFVHVADAARAAVDALDWPSGVVNIVDDEPAPGRDWLPVLADALAVPVPPAEASGARWQRGARNTRARSLGWQPRYPTWRTGFPAMSS
uniref:NAD-dependent epimerase/dehydratase family protein n=1 Tax=Actinomadura sp. CA-154981 TaxID=3240037 RepID=UPI003F496D26